MSDDVRFEEEEFQTQFNGGTIMRILGTVKPHWRWVLGFLISVGLVSVTESYFTYLNKRMIDEGILARDTAALKSIAIEYGVLMVIFVVMIFTFIYLAGVLGHRVQYDLRKHLFDHLQTLSFSYFDRNGWLDYLSCDIRYHPYC